MPVTIAGHMTKMSGEAKSALNFSIRKHQKIQEMHEAEKIASSAGFG